MSSVSTWSKTAANNSSSSPDGFPEGMAPSGVNNSAREVMAAIRTQREDDPWFNWGHTPTYISATSFSVPTDLTSVYLVGRRIRMVGTTPFTYYGTILTSAYTTLTTVTVTMDSGALNSTLNAVSLGFDPDTLAISSSSLKVVSSGSRNGMILSNDTDTDHDINITAGERQSSVGSTNIILSTQMTKRIDAAWGAGDNAGGFISLGAHTVVEINSSYPLYVVRDSATGAVDVVFIDSSGISSTDDTGDTLTSAGKTAIQSVTGYSNIFYKYLGSVITDASANIYQFKQRGNLFYYDVIISNFSGSGTTTASLQGVLTPNNIKTEAIIVNWFQDNQAGAAITKYLLITDPDQTDTAPDSGHFTNLALQFNTSWESQDVVHQRIFTDTSSQIRHRASSTSTSLSIATLGYVDQRGKE